MHKDIPALIQEILLIINLSQGTGLENRKDLKRLVDELLRKLQNRQD